MAKKSYEEQFAEVQRDYARRCSELGQMVYKVQALGWEIEATERLITDAHSALKELNEKADALSRKQQSKQEEEEPANEPTPAA